MRTFVLAGLVAGTLAVAAPAEGQRIQDGRVAARVERPASVPPTVVEQHIDPADIPDPAAQVIGGIVGGALGMIGGAYIGYAMETAGGCGPYNDMCGFGGFIIGGALGEAIGLGAGVQLFGGSRGTMGSAIGGSLLAGIGGALLASGTDGVLAPAIPVMQLLTAVVMNREAAARKSLRK